MQGLCSQLINLIAKYLIYQHLWMEKNRSWSSKWKATRIKSIIDGRKKLWLRNDSIVNTSILHHLKENTCSQRGLISCLEHCVSGSYVNYTQFHIWLWLCGQCAVQMSTVQFHIFVLLRNMFEQKPRMKCSVSSNCFSQHQKAALVLSSVEFAFRASINASFTKR